jgi:hypothetical protein
MSPGSTLVASWCAASTRGLNTQAWGDCDQWWTPAVEAVADALADAQAGAPTVDVVSASESLGRQRAAAGIYLDSARRDVRNLAAIAGVSAEVTASLVDALTLGWVDRTLEGYFTDACVDALTELASLPYLLTRLVEIYAEGERIGVHPSESHALIVVLATGRSDPLEAETQMIAAQVAMRIAFAGGETLARIGPHCAAVLSPRLEPRFGASLCVLRDELRLARAERRLPGARMWVESLPQRRRDLPGLIHEINDVGD